MKTMLLIDLVTMRKNAVLMCLVLVVLGAFNAYILKDVTVFLLLCIMCGMVSSYTYLLGVFSMEENNGWGQYRLALPLTRRQVVLGRYLSVLVSAVAAFALFSLIAYGVIATSQPLGLFPSEIPPSSGLIMMMMLYGMAALFAGASLLMPLVIWLGLNRGARVIALLLVMLPPLLLSAFGDTILGELSSSLSSSLSTTAPVLLLAGSLVLYAASALLSVHLYEAREL